MIGPDNNAEKLDSCLLADGRLVILFADVNYVLNIEFWQQTTNGEWSQRDTIIIPHEKLSGDNRFDPGRGPRLSFAMVRPMKFRVIPISDYIVICRMTDSETKLFLIDIHSKKFGEIYDCDAVFPRPAKSSLVSVESLNKEMMILYRNYPKTRPTQSSESEEIIQLAQDERIFEFFCLNVVTKQLSLLTNEVYTNYNDEVSCEVLNESTIAVEFPSHNKSQKKRREYEVTYPMSCQKIWQLMLQELREAPEDVLKIIMSYYSAYPHFENPTCEREFLPIPIPDNVFPKTTPTVSCEEKKAQAVSSSSSSSSSPAMASVSAPLTISANSANPISVASSVSSSSSASTSSNSALPSNRSTSGLSVGASSSSSLDNVSLAAVGDRLLFPPSDSFNGEHKASPSDTKLDLSVTTKTKAPCGNIRI